MSKNTNKIGDSRDGKDHRQSDHDIGDRDLYNGPRARMVLDPRGLSSHGTVEKIGPLERIVLIAMSIGMAFAIAVSIVVTPFAFLVYLTHQGIRKVRTFLTTRS